MSIPLYFLSSPSSPEAITFVITPENHERMFEKMAYYKYKGYGINVHPLLKQGFDWADHEKLWEDIYRLPYNIINIDKKWERKSFPTCIAGVDYFMMFPDGDYYRCYSAHINGDKPLGNIRDKFDLLEGRSECGRECSFPCDREIALR